MNGELTEINQHDYLDDNEYYTAVAMVRGIVSNIREESQIDRMIAMSEKVGVVAATKGRGGGGKREQSNGRRVQNVRTNDRVQNVRTNDRVQNVRTNDRVQNVRTHTNDRTGQPNNRTNGCAPNIRPNAPYVA